VSKRCTYCRGRGKIITKPCVPCEGTGHLERRAILRVRVPPGADDETVLRYPGEGEPAPHQGPAGDLKVVLRVGAHPIFRRDGRHLACEVPITVVEAALGAPIEVPTLDGKVRMKIPPGTQTGRTFRLRGKGVPAASGGEPGDQNVTVVVETPRDLTDAERAAVERLRELDSPYQNLVLAAPASTAAAPLRQDSLALFANGQHALSVPDPYSLAPRLHLLAFKLLADGIQQGRGPLRLFQSRRHRHLIPHLFHAFNILGVFGRQLLLCLTIGSTPQGHYTVFDLNLNLTQAHISMEQEREFKLITKTRNRAS